MTDLTDISAIESSLLAGDPDSIATALDNFAAQSPAHSLLIEVERAISRVEPLRDFPNQITEMLESEDIPQDVRRRLIIAHAICMASLDLPHKSRTMLLELLKQTDLLPATRYRALRELGRIFVTEGLLDDATTLFLRALGMARRMKDDFRVDLIMFDFGRAYLMRERFVPAFDTLSNLEGIFPENSLIWSRLELYMGRVLIGLGRRAEAMTALDHAERNLSIHAPQSYYHGATWLEKAHCYAADERHEEAFDCLEKAEALPHNRAALCLGKGEVLLTTGNVEAAAETLEEAFTLYSDSSNGLMRIRSARLLARAHEISGNVGLADRYLNYAFKEARRRKLTIIARSIRADMAKLNIAESALVTDKQIVADENTGVPGFVLGRKLGAGGFGAVFRAFDTDHDELVAIKIVKLSSIYDTFERDALRDSLVTELEAASRINHPGCVGVRALGETQDRDLFIVQDFVDGRPLNDYFGPDATIRQKRELLAKVAHAIDALHQANVVHRDLKPENIMVKPNGDPVLIDFGIARLAENSTAFTGAGSIHYMAPEQMDGKSVDKSADWFAYGVIALELLSGERPVTAFSKGNKRTRKISKVKALPLPNDLSRPFTKTLSDLIHVKPRSRLADPALIIHAMETY